LLFIILNIFRKSIHIDSLKELLNNINERSCKDNLQLKFNSNIKTKSLIESIQSSSNLFTFEIQNIPLNCDIKMMSIINSLLAQSSETTSQLERSFIDKFINEIYSNNYNKEIETEFNMIHNLNGLFLKKIKYKNDDNNIFIK
jgi:hypothetical protein